MANYKNRLHSRLALFLVVLFACPFAAQAETQKKAPPKTTDPIEQQEPVIENQIAAWQNQLAIKTLSPEEIESIYRDSSEEWRKLVDETFKVYSLESLSPNVSNLPKNVSSDEKTSTEVVLESASEIVPELASEDAAGEVNEGQHYRALRAVGAVRARSLQRLVALGHYSVFAFNTLYLDDLLRETHLVPYRFLALVRTKFLEVSNQLSEGWSGVWGLLPQLFALFVLIVLFFILFWAMFRFPTLLEGYKHRLLKTRKRSSLQNNLLIWIPRISALTPWFLVLIFLKFSDVLIERTMLAEFNGLSPYVRYYVYYRIFRIALAKILVQLSMRAKLLKEREMRLKVHTTARYLGLFVFGNLALLKAVESAVNKALVYTLVTDVVRLGAFVFLVWIARKWRHEISEALSANTDLVSKFLQQRSNGLLGFFARVLGLGWLVWLYLLDAIENFLQEFEFARKISAQIFRKKLEGKKNYHEETLASNLPKDYLTFFGFDPPEEPMIIETGSNVLARMSTPIDSWLAGRTEETLMAIVGNKGSGKSTTSIKLCKKFESSMNVVCHEVPPKLTTKRQVLDYVQKILALDSALNDADQLVNEDKKMKKTLVVLDSCQNFFIGHLGGFEGYKTFVELINAQTKNLFWVCIFNKQAWNYIDSVFSRHAFFRVVVEMPSWNEEDIRNLIISRHKRSGYKLSFDQIIAAANQSGAEIDYTEIETKFFRLLWEQSGGNPRAALYYWLSSLNIQSENKLRVGLPENDDFMLNSLNDEQLFVLASLARHENLSIKELVSTSHMYESLIRHSLKVATELSLIECDSSGRYTVSPEAQNAVIKMLRVKNFIYG